jgi:hypothetical protein
VGGYGESLEVEDEAPSGSFMMGGNGRDAAARFAERRRVEEEAQRLRDVVPRLESCRIEIAEGRNDATSGEVSHTRIVVVAVAPALFLFPCGDPSCRDGGHDVTREILAGLCAGKTEVKGEDACYGRVGTADCGRILRYRVVAGYRATP